MAFQIPFLSMHDAARGFMSCKARLTRRDVMRCCRMGNTEYLKADGKFAFSLTVGGMFWKSMEGFPCPKLQQLLQPSTQRLCVTCTLCCCTADFVCLEKRSHLQMFVEVKTQQPDARKLKAVGDHLASANALSELGHWQSIGISTFFVLPKVFIPSFRVS